MSGGAGRPQATPVGWWMLERPFVALGGGILRAGDGRASFSVALPPDPALEGLSLYEQAAAGALLTNAVRVVIRR